MTDKEKKKEYDRRRYDKIKNKEWFVTKKGNYYLRHKNRLLKESKIKAKRIPKIKVFDIIDHWSNGLVGYDRHKNLFIFAKEDIEKLKCMINIGEITTQSVQDASKTGGEE